VSVALFLDDLECTDGEVETVIAGVRQAGHKKSESGGFANYVVSGVFVAPAPIVTHA
jgi:hypothetical protein